MPTVFTHAVAALALGPAVRAEARTPRLWALAALCAVLPDADVLAFPLGIPYAHVFGHRGITHSLAFAAVVAVLIVAVFYRAAPRRVALWAFFSIATASHGLLDMLTDGGLGVALLAPFSTERLFFPWRPVQVSPIGAGFFSPRGIDVLMSEGVWIWMPAFVVAAVLTWHNRRSADRTRRAPGGTRSA